MRSEAARNPCLLQRVVQWGTAWQVVTVDCCPLLIMNSVKKLRIDSTATYNQTTSRNRVQNAYIQHEAPSIPQQNYADVICILYVQTKLH